MFDPERLSNPDARAMARELVAQGFEIRLERAWSPRFRIRGNGISLSTYRLGGQLRARIAALLRQADAARMG